MVSMLLMLTVLLPIVLTLTAPAEARITRIVIDRLETPTFEGVDFEGTGPYEKIVGRAFGEVDPRDPLKAGITDIELAPRNGAGKVEYDTDFYLLKPVDMSRGNGVLLYEVVNRGDKNLLNRYNFPADVVRGNDPTRAGDGFLQKLGYIILWSGWQGDVLPGNNRMTIRVPLATDRGTPITGRVRTEYIVNTPTSTQNLSSGASTGLTHASYETVSLDNTTATLTSRVREADPRVVVPHARWAFADCRTVPFPGVPSPTQICLQDGFDPNFIYELLYTAKNPRVLGLGFAATRDLVTFVRHAVQDDVGTPNPLAGGLRAAIMHGASQSGRYIRTFLDLGFNQDETGRIVFEGMHPHVAAGRLPLNVRFGQPGRAFGQHEDHLFPGGESPFTWKRQRDRVAGRTAGLLERCHKTHTCPKIMQTVSSTEYWNAGMSLNTTDALGRHDVGIPGHVRIFLFSSTQHAPDRVPTRRMCQQLSNPNLNKWGLRALLVALERWVLDGVRPPDSRIPTLRKRTLVPPDRLRWPAIPGVKYTELVNERTLLDFGPQFDPRTMSGVLTEPPTVVAGHDYVVLVPQVDTDGNEIAGIRSTTGQAPLGTYTGWSLRQAGFAEDEQCTSQGSFLPFQRTRAEREAIGDPRPSLEERYGDHAGYVAAVRAAADDLVAEGFLLPEDADLVVAEAEASDVLR